MHGRTLRPRDLTDVQRTAGFLPRQLMILARAMPANRVYFAGGARLGRTLALRLHSESLHNFRKLLYRVGIVFARQQILLAASTMGLKIGAPSSRTHTHTST